MSRLPYSFAFVYKDGKVEPFGGKSASPESVKYDFECQVEWEEYDEIVDSNISPKEILELAIKIYKANSFYQTEMREASRLAIYNNDTKEIVESIELN